MISTKNIMLACQQGSDDWLAARAGVCTASRFSIARDRLQRKSGAKEKGDVSDAAETYAQLLAMERIAGIPLDETFATKAMRRGTALEPVAREIYQAVTGYIVEEAGFVHTYDRWFGYSTDGQIYGHRGGIEIKCPSAAEKVAGCWLNPEPVVAEYLDQCDGGMWIEHWDWIDLVIYTPWLESVGKELFIRRIHRDQARIEALELDLGRFIIIVNKTEAALRKGSTT